MKNRTHLARWCAALVAVLALGGLVSGPAPAAYAAAGVSVTSSLGTAKADAEYSTVVDISGSGFQSIQGGMGGIYVLFGWVDSGGWRPSQGGVVGSDYLYVPDSESKENQGFQRFVAFPGSETEAAAQAVMSASGSWSVQLTIPGPSFQALDREGNATSVNCLEVTCGIITIGAHGIKNANNETFTPIAFVTPQSGTSTTPGADAVEEAAETPVTTAVGQLALGVDSAKATAGSALPFTARGFAVGEQVVASLDGGVVAVGPLTAGNAGEVAGVLPLPSDLAAGTHLLTVQGAATGGSVEAEITVSANALAVAATTTDAGTPAWLLIVTVIAIALALLLLIANVIVAIVRANKRRRERRAAQALPEETVPTSSDFASLTPPPLPNRAEPDDVTVKIPAVVQS